MKYTLSKEADKRIESDLDIVKKIVLKELKPKAMIMFGGFGRGEGSYKKIGKKILPLNDYDIYLVLEKKVGAEILERLGEECSRAMGRGGIEIVENFNERYDENKHFHVDLHYIEYKKLKKPYPTQRTFDLKRSLIFYGDKNITKQIPNIKISKSDAIRVLFNKLNHFTIAEGNSEIIKSIYSIKGFNDSCSALLIFYGGYTSKFKDREKIFKKMDFPNELKKLVSISTKAKLYNGYKVKNVDKFFEKSKKWVEWTLKKILKDHLKIKSSDWEIIAKETYKRLPYIYFNDYLGSRYLFFGQYYLNLMFFISGLRKGEFLIKSLIRWRDVGLIIGVANMLYSFGEEKEAKKYLRKLTNNTKDLRERILKLYSIYYLQKLV